MLETCPAQHLHWVAGSTPLCVDSDHEHRPVAVHSHLDQVELPDGTVLVAASLLSADPYRRNVEPDFGLYMDASWKPPWPHDHLDWPDFGVPSDAAPTINALTALLRRARVEQAIELGCLGGHGRTGTALACMGVLAGLPTDHAVQWIRRAYCDRAVETAEQAAFVETMATADPTS